MTEAEKIYSLCYKNVNEIPIGQCDFKTDSNSCVSCDYSLNHDTMNNGNGENQTNFENLYCGVRRRKINHIMILSKRTEYCIHFLIEGEDIELAKERAMNEFKNWEGYERVFFKNSYYPKFINLIHFKDLDEWCKKLGGINILRNSDDKAKIVPMERVSIDSEYAGDYPFLKSI